MEGEDQGGVQKKEEKKGKEKTIKGEILNKCQNVQSVFKRTLFIRLY